MLRDSETVVSLGAVKLPLTKLCYRPSPFFIALLLRIMASTERTTVIVRWNLGAASKYPKHIFPLEYHDAGDPLSKGGALLTATLEEMDNIANMGFDAFAEENSYFNTRAEYETSVTDMFSPIGLLIFIFAVWQPRKQDCKIFPSPTIHSHCFGTIEQLECSTLPLDLYFLTLRLSRRAVHILASITIHFSVHVYGKRSKAYVASSSKWRTARYEWLVENIFNVFLLKLTTVTFCR